MNDLYDTADMGLAIALICSDCELVSLESTNQTTRINFRFAINPELEHISQKYWNGKLSVDAKRFWNETKNLKTRLHNVSI